MGGYAAPDVVHAGPDDHQEGGHRIRAQRARPEQPSRTSGPDALAGAIARAGSSSLYGPSVPPRCHAYTLLTVGGVTIGRTLEEKRRMDRDRLLRNLRWLAEGNPRNAGTDLEGKQNPTVAQLMADDLLLSYIGDEEVTEVFNEIRRGFSA